MLKHFVFLLSLISQTPLLPKEAMANQGDERLKQNLERMIRKFEEDESVLNHLPSLATQLGFSSSPSIKATNTALILEQETLQRCNRLMMYQPNNPFLGSLDVLLSQKIHQIMGTKPSLVKEKANQLIEFLNRSPCPIFITNSMFAKKFLSACVEKMKFYNGLASLYAQVIIQLSSKVPHLMDFILAEFHRVCIYTVPKHIEYSENEFVSMESYYEAIGYKEGETQESYLERMGNYMRLYGAMVGTEKAGFHWLVRFLKGGLAPNVYTVVALDGFLAMAGFDLHKKYKFQFSVMLTFVSLKFLDGLVMEEDENLVRVLRRIGREGFLRAPAVCKNAAHLLIMEHTGSS